MQVLPSEVTPCFHDEKLVLNTIQQLWHLPEEYDGYCNCPSRKPPSSFSWTPPHKRMTKKTLILQQLIEMLWDLRVSFLPPFLRITANISYSDWVIPLYPQKLWPTKTISYRCRKKLTWLSTTGYVIQPIHCSPRVRNSLSKTLKYISSCYLPHYTAPSAVWESSLMPACNL